MTGPAELAQSLSHRATNLRETLWTEDQQRQDHNEKQLGKS
jgi:hypothetical protein